MSNLKLFILLTAFLIFPTAFVSAQTTDASITPEISVIQQKWHTETRNPALDENSSRENDEMAENENTRIANSRQNQTRSKAGLPLEVVPPPSISTDAMTTSGVIMSYIYEVRIKNTGLKQIRSIGWEYVFHDVQTKQESGRLKFVSVVKISSGDTKNITMRSASPPTGTIDAKSAGKKLS